MKKVLLILMLMTIGLSAQAQELKVGGVSVDLTKNTNYSQNGLVTGYYNYFYTTKKLVLYSAVTLGKIESTVDGLTILFNGVNNISGGFVLEGTTLMSVNKDEDGNYGTVNVVSSIFSLESRNTISDITIAYGKWIFDNTVVFKGNMTIKGGADVTVNKTTTTNSRAIWGDGTSSKLTIDNSSLNINGNKSCMAVDVRLILKGCVIASPVEAIRIRVGAEYVASNPAYISDMSGYSLKGNLTIKPGTAYGLWIRGVQVNSLNYRDIWQLETTGSTSNVSKMSYNPSTKVLTLSSNSQLDSGDDSYPLIHNEISGLTINTYGTVTIGNSDDNWPLGIESYEKCTINGNGGNLIVNSSSENGKAISVKNSSMTINDIALTASGYYGLYGKGSSKIYVNNSTLDISGSEKAIYVENEGFDPDDNCFITFPINGFKYGSSVYTLDESTNGLICAKKVRTRQKTKVATSIQEPNVVETNAPTRVYTTTGQLIWNGTGQPQLPSGIYIINGRKVVVK